MFSGSEWATNSLTYSFPADASLYGSYSTGEPANNFKAFTATQQAQIRNVLQNYSDVANLKFTEVAESASSTGTIRYAESDKPSTAWGYYPSSGAAGGDAWFNNTSHHYDNPAKGNYAYSLFLHETGHTLGLKHPHETSGQFGVMPADHDSVEYTVMSYHSYVGSSIGSYSIGSGSYPQSLMMYDIAAVQAMYGANYTTENGDTIYRWDPTTGRESINGVAEIAPTANKIFLTIWDGGGNDTYDFSNYTTSLNIDLRPGSWTTVSSAQLASLGGGKVAIGNIANALLYQNNQASLVENAIGGSGDDIIAGNDVANQLTGGKGNDSLDGGVGIDTARYSGLEANYAVVQKADGSWTVTDLRTGSPDGVDSLTRMEFLKFSDTTVALGATPPSPPLSTNQAPVAANDSAKTSEDTAVDINVLANDGDPDGNVISIYGAPAALHGTVTVNSNGSLHYTPTANYFGADTISYKITDGLLAASAQVSVTITAVNDLAIAQDDSYSIGKGKKLTVSGNGIVGNDSDIDGNALSAVLVTNAAHGTLKLNANGTFTYTPTGSFTGTDSFVYKDFDGTGYSNVATVTIAVGVGGGAGGKGQSIASDISAVLNMADDQVPALIGSPDAHHHNTIHHHHYDHSLLLT